MALLGLSGAPISGRELKLRSGLTLLLLFSFAGYQLKMVFDCQRLELVELVHLVFKLQRTVLASDHKDRIAMLQAAKLSLDFIEN